MNFMHYPERYFPYRNSFVFPTDKKCVFYHEKYFPSTFINAAIKQQSMTEPNKWKYTTSGDLVEDEEE